MSGAPVPGRDLDPGRLDALLAARRILVLGPSGAGKTRLTLRLAALLGLEAVHLDREFWQPGWRTGTPLAEWHRRVEALAARESWIMDGTYERSLELRVPAADAILYLHEPVAVCLLRAAWRRLASRRRARPDAPPGQPLDLAFLRYIWRFPRDSRPLVMQCLERHGAGKLVLYLDGSRRAEDLLERLGARRRPPGAP